MPVRKGRDHRFFASLRMTGRRARQTVPNISSVRAPQAGAQNFAQGVELGASIGFEQSGEDRDAILHFVIIHFRAVNGRIIHPQPLLPGTQEFRQPRLFAHGTRVHMQAIPAAGLTGMTTIAGVDLSHTRRRFRSNHSKLLFHTAADSIAAPRFCHEKPPVLRIAVTSGRMARRL